MNLNRINFGFQRNTFCCGVWEIGEFGQRDKIDYKGKPIAEDFPSFEKLFENFERRLRENIVECAGVDDEDLTSHFLITATLVTSVWKDGQPQMAELAEYFLKSGWEVAKKFTNANTGNEVTLFHRMVTAEEMGICCEEEDDSW